MNLAVTPAMPSKPAPIPAFRDDDVNNDSNPNFMVTDLEQMNFNAVVTVTLTDILLVPPKLI